MKFVQAVSFAGEPRFIEKRFSVLLVRVLGASLVAIQLFFVVLVSSLPTRLGPLFVIPAGAGVASAFTTAVMFVMRRRLVLFDGGFAIPRVRLRELFQRQIILPYESILSVRLIRPEGVWAWWIETSDGRHLAIPEWVFREKSAVHEFLLTKWPQARGG